MNKLLIATLLAIGAGTAAAGANSAAQDHGYAVYRQVVLGDTSVSAASPSTFGRSGDLRVPGPYARYLMNLGQSKRDAIAQAGRIGEAASRPAPATAGEPVRFSSHERYQRSVLGRSESEILRDRRAAPRRVAKVRAGE